MNMFTKCCGCKKKDTKTKKIVSNDSESTKQSLRKSETNTDLNHTDTYSKDNASTEPVTPILQSVIDELSNMPEVVAQNNQSSESTKQDLESGVQTEIKEEDCDDVFREGTGPPIPLATNLATPYPVKKGSLAGLPRWFSEEDDGESGGTQEPPATPVGKDELALRRHRFFSELMMAAQAQVSQEHRVRFDPLGPVVAGGPDDQGCNHQALTSELELLIIRLEEVASRLEKSAGIIILSEISEEREIDINMSLASFQDILNGTFAHYLSISQEIGGDVATHSDLVNKAFQAQLQYLTIASQNKQPDQTVQMVFLQPTSECINAIQNFREKNRASTYFNHLSSISESIPALGWVTISPAPAPYVKEMNDAGQFYTNRVLKDWKEKNKKHVEWAKSWVQTLSELQQFVKQHHTTGLVWSGTGTAKVPPSPTQSGCPPPPPIMNIADMAPSMDDSSQDRSALFAQINQGEAITKSLKKVTSEMQTHKNPTLRTGPAPFKTPICNNTQVKSVTPSLPIDKPPNFSRDGKKWLVEYQKSNQNLLVENAEMNNVVYMFKCVDSTIQVKGKINSIVIDSCKKSSVVFDSLVSSVEFINCQSVQMQVLGKVPTISVDKTDGCQMYLSPESLEVEIISSKSSEMNVLVPKGNGDYAEYPVPEQFKTTIVPGKGLSTIILESKG